ncbi:MAG: bifunctional 4-hydroxy-2-oxoglutarate aldolase/2-dehydro-3-deoxy-phosphogluconate aldolase [Saprospiraceae bacterium]|nr:bifunctional 4-hydroxy-2-oxoglutarate aldolase/2-dehydro-3-deoxy-phosphogluconate aldolase [Saprospiraceae bacterium]
MARFTRIQVYQKMAEQGMVPLFYHADVSLCKQVVAACYRGGARLLEFTSRGDFAHEVFGELSKHCASEMPDMILGVGSLTDAAAASLYMQLGANFVVTPALREDVVLTCNRRKVASLPGCGSVTEICRAEELGCEIVKLFPSHALGPDFVKFVRAPQPWTNIMPTSGVVPTEENLRAWFQAGVTCVGLGSQLISSEVLKSGDFDSLEKRVRETLALISKLRNF